MRFWIDNGKILIIYWLNFFNYLSKIKYLDFKKTCIIWFISYHKIFNEENQIIEHLWGRENYFFFGKLTEQNLFLKYFATWRDTNGVSILFNLYLRNMKLWVENFKIVPTSVKTLDSKSFGKLQIQEVAIGEITLLLLQGSGYRVTNKGQDCKDDL